MIKKYFCRNTFNRPLVQSNRLIILIFSVLIWLSSCSTELEVNAPYHEVKVMYALIDPRQPNQTVRISKGFQNEGRSAQDIAANSPDSSQYGTGILKVELQEIGKNSQLKRSFLMFDSTVANKDSGLFYWPDQRVYKTVNFVVDTSVIYKIKVTNTKTGSISEATTALVGRNLRFLEPIPERPQDPLSLAFSTKSSSRIKIDRFVNAALMQAVIHWNIRVYTSETEYRDEVWTWDAPGELASNNDTDPQVLGTFGPGSFWNYIAKELAARGNETVYGRKFMASQIEVMGASSDFKKYKQVYNNYNSITQSLPIYTNVTNGLGVVASRNSRTFPIQLDILSADTLNKRIPEFKLIK